MAGEYSNLPGFRLCDFPVECHGDSNVCPGQANLVSDYVGNAGDPDVPIETSYADEALLMGVLTGFRMTRRARACGGSEGGQCPAWMQMKETGVQGKFAQGIKEIILSRGN